MTEYRAKIRSRMVWMIVSSVLLVLFLAAVVLLVAGRLEGTYEDGFIAGVQTGLFLCILIYLVCTAVRYGRGLQSEEALQKLYIAETDERCRFIRDKIGNTGLNLALIALAVATVVAGFLNTTVFFTLLAATAAVALIKAGLKCYFSRKY